MTAIARNYPDCRFVDEFHWLILRKTPREAGLFECWLQERLLRFNAHKLPVLWSFLLKLHVTITLRVQGVIPTNTDIDAWMNSSATLPNENVACNHPLAAKNLDAQAFGFGVTTVFTTTTCFFMCHFKYLSS